MRTLGRQTIVRRWRHRGGAVIASREDAAFGRSSRWADGIPGELLGDTSSGTPLTTVEAGQMVRKLKAALSSSARRARSQRDRVEDLLHGWPNVRRHSAAGFLTLRLRAWSTDLGLGRTRLRRATADRDLVARTLDAPTVGAAWQDDRHENWLDEAIAHRGRRMRIFPGTRRGHDHAYPRRRAAGFCRAPRADVQS